MRAAPHKPTDGVPWLIQLLLVVQQAKDTVFKEGFGKQCKVGAFDFTSIKTVKKKICCNLWCPFLLCFLTQQPVSFQQKRLALLCCEMLRSKS